MQISVDFLDRVVLARSLILRGYINQVINLETGLKGKTLYRLRQSLKKEGFTWNEGTRCKRKAQTIIKKVCHRQDFTLIMLAYRQYGGQDVYRTLDIDALNKAHDTYLLIKREISPHAEDLANINDCYSLAVDLRSDDAEFVACSECRIDYFITHAQETSYSCPFCTNRKSAIKNRDEAFAKAIA